MSILIRTFFPCKCQKTQSNLALLFLAQMLQEPRGETGFRAGLPRGAQRVSLGPSFSPSLSPVSSVTALFSDWLICGWKTATMPLTYLSVGTSSMTERPPPTSSLSLWSWLDIVSMVEKSLRWAVHYTVWPFPSYIIHLWRELGKTGFSKERKGVIPKEGVMVGGWSGSNKEWPQYRCSFVFSTP